jgi:hypothetical protein
MIPAKTQRRRSPKVQDLPDTPATTSDLTDEELID